MKEIDTAIYGALTAGTALMSYATGIYRGTAPGTATFPYVQFMENTGGDQYALSGRVARSLNYTIKAIDDGLSASNAGTIFNEIDLLLNGATLTSGNWQTIYLRRTNSIEYEERDQDKIYQHVGGIYEITVRQTT